jgi:nucleoside-diphosphate-sugar epimerase
MEKVLVTGASGFVGGFVVEKIKADNKYIPVSAYSNRKIEDGVYLNLGMIKMSQNLNGKTIR